MLPGMPARLFVATPTKLLTFADCKRKYRYTYLETTAAAEGPAVGAQHGRRRGARDAGRLLALAGDAPYPGRGGRAAARELAARGLPGRRAVGALARAIRRDGRGVPRQASTRTPSRAGWSAPSSFTTARASLAARPGGPDRRAARRGPARATELAIVDYKTGRRPLTATDARSSLAMALYVLGARRVLRRPCTRVELHHLPTEHGRGRGPRRRRRWQRHQRRAESIADDAAAAEKRWRDGPDAGRGGRGVPAGTVAAVRLVRLRPALPAGPPGGAAAGVLGRARGRDDPEVRRRLSPPTAARERAGDAQNPTSRHRGVGTTQCGSGQPVSDGDAQSAVVQLPSSWINSLRSVFHSSIEYLRLRPASAAPRSSSRDGSTTPSKITPSGSCCSSMRTHSRSTSKSADELARARQPAVTSDSARRLTGGASWSKPCTLLSSIANSSMRRGPGVPLDVICMPSLFASYSSTSISPPCRRQRVAHPGAACHRRLADPGHLTAPDGCDVPAVAAAEDAADDRPDGSGNAAVDRGELVGVGAVGDPREETTAA